MKINKKNFFTALGIVTIITCLRIPMAYQYTIISNYTPLGAMALFSGLMFNKKWQALFFTLLPMLLVDLFINIFIYNRQYGIMYEGWVFIYIIFAIITLSAPYLISKIKLLNVVSACILISVFHWIASDLVTFYTIGIDFRYNKPFTHNLDGLTQCLIQGLPFLKNFLISTTFYLSLMLVSFYLILNQFSENFIFSKEKKIK